jgi:hypothetical protein
MSPERKKKFSELAKALKGLSEDQKIDMIIKHSIVNTEGKSLSGNNVCLMLLQQPGTIPTIVGGYRQWQKAGRQVSKGQHGMMIWYPSSKKNEDGEDEETRFFVGTVFDISQTEEKAKPPATTPAAL